ARAAGLEVTAEINLGTGEQDYRVPDLAVHRPGAAPHCHPTAALCVEVLSPGDETFNKLDFYAVHHVDELLIVDPDARTVDWRALTENAYEPVERSQLIELSAAELAARIDWPG
ncbi:MAG: Uma2 family endonuclease, partial [Solirubrobacteraceae bacterium]